MRQDTKNRKKATAALREVQSGDWLRDRMCQVLLEGKQGFDVLMHDLGVMVAETIMAIEREELAGPDYAPKSPEIRKWAAQPGSVYVGDQKVRVQHPRVRGPDGEISLGSYERLKQPGTFSQELLDQMLRGVSAQKYRETVTETAQALGVSPSSVSRHVVEATAAKLQEFKERPLGDFTAFAVFLDTIHRGGAAYIVALGVDMAGKKMALGFWEGASENHTICEELLADLERRGMILGKRILFVTDGGKGVIKALRDRFGKKLIHQRCTIHKDRNIQRHLPKRYRKEAHRRYTTALSQNSYADAKSMLVDFERWLRDINESAADSLLEAMQDILTLHRLKMPALLRKTMHSTNPIESMFSIVRDGEGNIKRYRNSKMGQRWLAASILHAESIFMTVKGHADIEAVLKQIEKLQNEPEGLAA